MNLDQFKSLIEDALLDAIQFCIEHGDDDYYKDKKNEYKDLLKQLYNKGV